MTETKVNPEDNPEEGQVEGEHGQPEVTPTPIEGQPEEAFVELSDGEKVTLEELKKGYMKDADYRQKTADVANERIRLAAIEEERNRRGYTGGREEPEEEVNPLAIIDQRLTRMEMLNAKAYLTTEIDRLEKKFPEADKKSVYDSCWNNPNAVIENEMNRSHTSISERISKKGTDVEALLKADPKAEEKLKKKYIDEYNAKKQLKANAGTGTGAGGGETVIEEVKPAGSRSEASANLRERLKAIDSSEL